MSDAAMLTWNLWEGNQLVLEMEGHGAKHMHTVEYRDGGWPLVKVYRVFAFDPDTQTLHAQLEKQGTSALMDGS